MLSFSIKRGGTLYEDATPIRFALRVIFQENSSSIRLKFFKHKIKQSKKIIQLQTKEEIKKEKKSNFKLKFFICF